jgi:hypothetical protein
MFPHENCYGCGREDFNAGLEPQYSGEDYIRGWNFAKYDAEHPDPDDVDDY